MVAYGLSGGAKKLIDPAVGAGAFLVAAQELTEGSEAGVTLGGGELDPAILSEAVANGVDQRTIKEIRIGDFVLDPPEELFPAIVANPPYIRHHRVDAETKAKLQELAVQNLGKRLDGRTGYHIFFLIRALTQLEPEGKLAFIMPADTCEGVFARDLWDWIGSEFNIEGTVVFTPEATPFPGVDTNAVIFLIERSKPTKKLKWMKVTEQGTPALERALRNLKRARSQKGLEVETRETREALETGLSRPMTLSFRDDPQLGQLARVVRGIATGANEFFFMTKEEAEGRGIPPEFLVRAVGRTRDAQEEVLRPDHLEALDKDGKPTYLFTTGDRLIDELPPAVRNYIEEGTSELQERALIKARKHWYRCEQRETPPFLFAYLGRRNARFIRNESEAVPLTGFLCVYPLNDDIPLDALWKVLNASATHERLASVGKSYGGGAIKVEPRALERLPLDKDAVAAAGLQRFLERTDKQLEVAA